MNQFGPGLLQDFFEGKLSSAGLAISQTEVLSGSHAREKYLSRGVCEDYAVLPAHLIRLCDAVLDGYIEPSRLEDIACTLVSSRRFVWNALNLPNDRVNHVIHAWNTPDLNYELSTNTVVKFRTLLGTGQDDFTERDRGPASR